MTSQLRHPAGIGLFVRALATTALCGATAACFAQAPPTVSQPAGINTGGTSFFDGITGTEPGWAYLSTLRATSADAIRDHDGARVAAFNAPRIRSVLLLNQFSYSSTVKFGGARLGFNAIVPLVDVDGRFDRPGAALSGGGTALGDVTLGPVLQFDPTLGPGGHPLFVHRFELDAILPTGGYRRDRDLNQSSGYYSVNPYWAASLFPAEKWEVSWRVHWLYNFKNQKPASGAPAAYRGVAVANTQAGRAAWINFTTSYELLPRLHVGLNGYYFKQLSDDKVNGRTLADSREQVLGIGPGLMYEINRANGKRDAFWLNVYTEKKVENRASNTLIMQARFVYTF